MSPNNTPILVTMLLAAYALAAQLSISQVPTLEAIVALTVFAAVLVTAIAVATYFVLKKRRKCPNAPK